MKYHAWGLLVLALFANTDTTTLAAETVTYFRGDHGVADDDQQPLPTRLDKTDATWKADLKPGNSTPCIHGDRIFVTTFDKDSQSLWTVALDRKDGKVLWRQQAPTDHIEQYHPVGSPASSTPASDGRFVYVFFGSCGLLCYDFDGKLIWHKPMGPFQDEFGASSSPVLVGNKIILNQDHDVDCFITAIDTTSGKTVWKTPRKGFTRSYSTPIAIEVDGRRQVVVAGSLQLAAYDVETGEKQWWVNGLSRILDSTPVVADGTIFLATWTPGGDAASRIKMEPFEIALDRYDKNDDSQIAESELLEGPVLQRFFRIDVNQDKKLDRDEWNAHSRVFALAQNVALSIKPGGRGDVTSTNVNWTYGRGLPTVPSPLVYRGVMYMIKDSGIITSLAANTGDMLKQGRARGSGNYYASPIAGDGKVYMCSERGVITVLKAGGAWDIISSHDFNSRIMATPVIRDDQFFVRTDDGLYCFSSEAR